MIFLLNSQQPFLCMLNPSTSQEKKTIIFCCTISFLWKMGPQKNTQILRRTVRTNRHLLIIQYSSLLTKTQFDFLKVKMCHLLKRFSKFQLLLKIKPHMPIVRFLIHFFSTSVVRETKLWEINYQRSLKSWGDNQVNSK